MKSQDDMGRKMALDLVQRVIRGELDTCENKIECWKADHKLAMVYFKVCDIVKEMNELFQSLTQLDDDFRREFYSQESAFSESTEGKIDELFRRWTRLAQEVFSDLVPWAESNYEGVDGAEELRCSLKEGLGIIADPHEFFAGDSLVEARDMAIDEHINGQGSQE